MSAGGGNGYYKHRCKYYYTHNCENWIWVANTACSTCIAAGRDEEEAIDAPGQRYSTRDVVGPQLRDGSLESSLTELIEPLEATSGSTVGYKHLE